MEEPGPSPNPTSLVLNVPNKQLIVYLLPLGAVIELSPTCLL